jgi:hypothetical protein
MQTNINNSQIADMLPLKTIPEANNRKDHALKPKTKVKTLAPTNKKARICSVRIEEIENEGSPRNIAAENAGISPTSSFEIPNSTKVSHLFYNVQ